MMMGDVGGTNPSSSNQKRLQDLSVTTREDDKDDKDDGKNSAPSSSSNPNAKSSGQHYHDSNFSARVKRTRKLR